MCFSTMLVHGHIPEQLTKTVIIKNKAGDINSKGNYRLIALTTVVSKVLEHILLVKCGDKLDTYDNQFGFKARHSTDTCLFALKQVIQYYRRHSSPVFVCYLYASKAYDRVNHWSLFKAMIKKASPCL